MSDAAAIHLLFDLAAWAAGLIAGFLVYRWRLTAVVARTAARTTPGYFVALAAGGLLGAFLLGTLNLHLSAHTGVGRSILGALFGAIVAIEVYKLKKGIRFSTGGIFVVPFCVGVMVGRLGCLASGLDDFTYGIPTGAAWGWDFGDGVMRHPVQLYEAVAMAAFLIVYLILLARRSPLAVQRGFYLCAGWYAAQRFLWEFLKPYGGAIGPLNTFHIVSILIMLYSLIMIGTHRHADA